MQRMHGLTTVLATALLAAGCGALFNSGPAQLSVNSTPAGADVLVNGQRMGQTPTVLELSKDDDHVVELRSEGYEPISFAVNRKVSATYVVLDVLGGLVPVVIDAATGSWYTLSRDSITGTLQRSQEQSGELTAEQLEAVKRGVPARTFIQQP